MALGGFCVVVERKSGFGDLGLLGWFSAWVRLALGCGEV